MAEIKTVLVCGAGTMGSGIAQTFAAAGFSVKMYDVTAQLVEGGFTKIQGPLKRRVERGKMKKEDVDAIVGRIKGTSDLKEACSGVDYVVEAVFEDMKVKKEVFKTLDEQTPAHAILASNTSSLSISEMAAATKRPEMVIGMHFFNPAPVMQLIEVIRGAATSDETVAASKALASRLGKSPVEVKESPGFVVNRLLVPMMNEAFNLLQEGVASAEDIDKAMKMGTNMPMGPFELADYTGLDIGLHTMETLFHETGDPKFRPSPMLRKYVRAGRVGMKVGKGVYNYNEKGERVS
jgi:3-hydroxybutyryl-CoA dehydrogenase